MLEWLRKLFSATHSGERASMDAAADSDASYTRFKFSDLYVEPDDPGDFDPAACDKLLAAIARSGVTHVDEIENVAVTVEDFFVGNNSRYSIAANVEIPSPFDKTSGWLGFLQTLRSSDGIDDVFVGISMVEPYKGGRVGMWPYSDSVWVYTSLGHEAVSSLVAPLDPDDVRAATTHDPDWQLTPPFPTRPGLKAYRVWWD